jgi:hypothetical protein
MCALGSRPQLSVYYCMFLRGELLSLQSGSNKTTRGFRSSMNLIGIRETIISIATTACIPLPTPHSLSKQPSNLYLCKDTQHDQVHPHRLIRLGHQESFLTPVLFRVQRVSRIKVCFEMNRSLDVGLIIGTMIALFSIIATRNSGRGCGIRRFPVLAGSIYRI